MDTNGEYLDYFTVFKQKEKSWLKTKKKEIIENPKAQKDFMSVHRLSTSQKYPKIMSPHSFRAFNKIQIKREVNRIVKEHAKAVDMKEYQKLLVLNEA